MFKLFDISYAKYFRFTTILDRNQDSNVYEKRPENKPLFNILFTVCQGLSNCFPKPFIPVVPMPVSKMLCIFLYL